MKEIASFKEEALKINWFHRRWAKKPHNEDYMAAE